MRIYQYLLALFLLSTISSSQDLTRYVDPMTGTSGTGHTYPGATVPYGMVQLSPDTRRDDSWEGCSGYYYKDTLIYGFSHTHLSGTGASDYGDILLMPTSGPVSFDPTVYASRYSHADETAQPGYYAVTLTDNNLRAELTASQRVGMHRYSSKRRSFDSPNIIIDLRHRDKTRSARLKLISPTRIEGHRYSEGWAKDQRIFFVMEFSRPIASCLTNHDGKILLPGREIESDSVAAVLTFRRGSEDIMVKVAVSTVDCQGAYKNLAAEIPHWDFGQVRREATERWNDELGRIHVFGKNNIELTNFYTALYHTMVAPNVLSDVDGRHRGRDNQIHSSSTHTQYTVFSLWDTFRAAHPLYTLIDSVRTLDYIKTFLTQYQQGGRLPVWELAANETDCMIGYHSVPVITDALAKGINAFDTSLAFEAMKASATWDHLGLPAYMARGYLSIEDEHESVSKTLEYAYDDWCIAEVARMLGKTEDMQTYYRRAASYRNVFDTTTGFMRPRRNGDFLRKFDPREVNFHFTEANSWQYSFFVPHDIPGLVGLMGGASKMEQKLDELFTSPAQTTGRTQADITGLIGQYAHGNEPSHHMAYLYDYIGKPWKTQRIVRKIMDSLYKPGPDGLPGNEDCGQMSAWYVWSALGLYPVTPGSPYYAIGTPLFDSAHVSVGNRSIRVIADRDSSSAFYVHAVHIDGKEHLSNLITHAELTSAREIRFTLRTQPSMQRGSDVESRGAMPDVNFVTAPVIVSADKLFTDSTTVTIVGQDVRYSINGDSLDLPLRYSGPITITTPTRIHAKSYRGQQTSGVTSANFYKLPSKWDVTLANAPNPQYTAEGPVSMIDGIRGSVIWRRGDWTGFWGKDMEVEIRMDKVKTISSVSAGFLQDVRPWIVFPTSMIVQTSKDGKKWKTAGNTAPTVAVTDMTPQLTTLTVSFPPTQARYVRVLARTYGKLPAWHPGAGNEAFIFCDEIQIRD